MKNSRLLFTSGIFAFTLMFFQNCGSFESSVVELASETSVHTESNRLDGIYKDKVVVSCGGDGITDDTECLRSYFTQNKVELVFPKNKKYLLTKSILVEGSMSVHGNGSTLFTDDSFTANSLIKINASDVVFDGFVVLRKRTTTLTEPVSNALVAIGANVSNIVIQNSHFESEHSLVGVLMEHPRQKNITVQSNTFVGMRRGVVLNNGRFTQEELDDPLNHLNTLKVIANEFINCSSNGVLINSPVYGGTHPSLNKDAVARDIEVSSNKIRSTNANSTTDYCIGLAGGERVRVANNKMSSCKWQGIHIEDEALNVYVIDNEIGNVLGHGPGDSLDTWRSGISGIWVIGSKDIRILRNTIGDAIHSGIAITWNSNKESHNFYNENIIIAGNVLANAGDAVIKIGGKPGSAVSTHIGEFKEFGPNFISPHAESPCAVSAQVSGVTVSDNNNFTCSSF